MKSIKMLLMAAFTILACTSFAQEKAGKKDTTLHAVLYTCPMHADVSSSEKGTCPKCGMDLQLSMKEQMKMKVTKNYTCPVHAGVVSNKKGKCPQCGSELILSPKEKMKVEVTKLFSCPMHPDVTSKEPGKCPKCNMDLKEIKKDQPVQKQ